MASECKLFSDFGRRFPRFARNSLYLRSVISGNIFAMDDDEAHSVRIVRKANIT